MKHMTSCIALAFLVLTTASANAQTVPPGGNPPTLPHQTPCYTNGFMPTVCGNQAPVTVQISGTMPNVGGSIINFSGNGLTCSGKLGTDLQSIPLNGTTSINDVKCTATATALLSGTWSAQGGGAANCTTYGTFVWSVSGTITSGNDGGNGSGNLQRMTASTVTGSDPTTICTATGTITLETVR